MMRGGRAFAKSGVSEIVVVVMIGTAKVPHGGSSASGKLSKKNDAILSE